MITGETNVIELNTELKHTPLEYVYVTIPAEYVCVYHKILAMLADYGIDMLKDCKASCKDRNSGVIECFNMFNAAVAARKLGGGVANNQYTKLAATLIKYIKSKINQIYKSKDNSTDFVFPLDENGEIKAFVSCGERPLFYISPEDGNLYEHKFNNGFTEHFILGPEDYSEGEYVTDGTEALAVTIDASYEETSDTVVPCANVTLTNTDDNSSVAITADEIEYYFDGTLVRRFEDVKNLTVGAHKFEVVIKKDGKTYHSATTKIFNGTSIQDET